MKRFRPAGPFLVLALLLSWSWGRPQNQTSYRRPFGDSFSRSHPQRARTYDLQHVVLKLTLDERRKSVSGTSTLVLRPLSAGLEAVEVDSAELEIHSVELADRTTLPFTQSGETIRISLPHPAGPAETISLSIAYEATPRKGLYFVGPDRAYPNKTAQIWSQGEMEDSHFWFPVYDAPNDKATSEGYYTVNGDLTVISNGRLEGVEENRAAHTRTFHWKQDTPHSTYLISVVAGKFEKYTDQVDGIPVEYYVPPGTGRQKALRSFGETPDAMRFFSERMGLRYPYPKYSQVTVEDFTFGGMENTSATTLADRMLHEEISEPQAGNADLVTHELAHQWFGDWLTCADWSHIWLNEGFATFWAAIYREYRYGEQEYRYAIREAQARYLDEDRQRYRRPLVTPVYSDPLDLFDRTTYQKGAVVLDMLRFVLGDERFFAALRDYVKTHPQAVVTTEDFQQSVERAAGKDLGWFFDEWVYQAGYPELEVSQDWDEAERQAHLVVEQKQEVDETTPLFRMPVDVEFTTPAGRKIFRVELSKARESFSFSLDHRPLMTRFDPDHRIVKTMQFRKPVSDLLYQLDHDPSVPGRMWTSEQLGQAGNVPEAVQGLRSRLAGDRFWGVKEAAAAALGQIRSEEAREALTVGLRDTDPRVRQAAVRALGAFSRDSKAARLAETMYNGDRNPVVAAEAAHAIGKIQDKQAWGLLRRAVERESDQDVIRRFALAGLAELGDPKGWDIAARWMQYGRPSQTRLVAVDTLSRLGSKKEKTADRLIALLNDPDPFVKQRAVYALGEGNFQKARSALLKSLDSEVDSSTRRAVQRALQRLGPLSSSLDSAARPRAGMFVPVRFRPGRSRGTQDVPGAFAGTSPERAHGIKSMPWLLAFTERDGKARPRMTE